GPAADPHPRGPSARPRLPHERVQRRSAPGCTPADHSRTRPRVERRRFVARVLRRTLSGRDRAGVGVLRLAPPPRLAAAGTLRRRSGPTSMDNFTVTLGQGEPLLDGVLKA